MLLKKDSLKKPKKQFICWICNRGNSFGAICDSEGTQIPKGLVPLKPKTNY